LHDGVAGDTRDLIQAAGVLQAVFAMFAVFGLVGILEALDGADNRPMRVPHRHRPNVHENAVTSFVVNIAVGFGGMCALDRGSDRTFVAACFACVLVALQKSSPRARSAHDLVTKIAGDAFRAVAPENDFPLKVDNTDSYLQTVQHASTYLRILKGKHRLSLVGSRLCFHRHNPQQLQANLSRRSRVGMNKRFFINQIGVWHFRGIGSTFGLFSVLCSEFIFTSEQFWGRAARASRTRKSLGTLVIFGRNIFRNLGPKFD